MGVTWLLSENVKKPLNLETKMYIPKLAYESLPLTYVVIGIVGLFSSVNFGILFGVILIIIAIYIHSKRKFYRSMVKQYENYKE